MLAVPFYGPDHKLKGSITRNNAFRRMVPDPDFALVNTGNGYSVTSFTLGQAARLADAVSAGIPDKSLFYSEMLPIVTPDARSPWALWAGRPNHAFLGSSAVASI